MKLKTTIFTLTPIISALLLAACGGSAATSGTGTGSSQLTLNTPQTLSLAAGDSLSLSGTAASFPETITSVKWTAVSKNNSANPLVLTNADCAVATATAQQSVVNGHSQNQTTCAVGVQAPAGVTSESQYTLSMTATDAKGNSSVSSTAVTVQPTFGVTGSPIAALTLPFTANTSDTITSTCDGSQGYATVPGVYSYQWLSTPDLALTVTNFKTARFVAPVVKDPTVFQITCRVTDDNHKTGSSTASITVNPPPLSAAPTLVPIANAGGLVSTGTLVNLNATNSKWVDATGTTVNKPIYYYWSQKTGPAVSIQNANNAVANVVMPSFVSQKTVITFTLSVSDQAFAADGTSSNAVATEVSYYLAAATAFSVSAPNQVSVNAGDIVKIPATLVSATPVTAPVYYSWTQVAGPSVALTGLSSPTLSYVAPVNVSAAPLSLTFRLSADYSPISAANPGAVMMDVTDYVIANAPFLLASTGVLPAAAGDIVKVTVTPTAATSAPINNSIYYSWTQVSGPAVTIAGGNSNTLNFVAPANGTGKALELVFKVNADYNPITASNPGAVYLTVITAVKP